MKCLDSSFIIDFLRNKSNAVKKAKEIEGKKIVTTYVNFFEIITGELRRHSEDDLHVRKAKELFSRIDVLELNEDSALMAARINAELAKRGAEINIADSLVAGIMLSNGFKDIITNDKDFSKIKELNVERY